MQEKQRVSDHKGSFDHNKAKQYFNAAGIAGTDPRHIDSRGGSSKRRNIKQLLNRDDLSEIDAQSDTRSMSYTKPGPQQQNLMGSS